jgi:hypothetical protein
LLKIHTSGSESFTGWGALVTDIRGTQSDQSDQSAKAQCRGAVRELELELEGGFGPARRMSKVGWGPSRPSHRFLPRSVRTFPKCFVQRFGRPGRTRSTIWWIPTAAGSNEWRRGRISCMSPTPSRLRHPFGHSAPWMNFIGVLSTKNYKTVYLLCCPDGGKSTHIALANR